LNTNLSEDDEISSQTHRTKVRTRSRANTPNSVSLDSPSGSQRSKISTIGATKPAESSNTVANWSSRLIPADYRLSVLYRVTEVEHLKKRRF